MFFQDGLTGSAWGDWALYTDSPLRAFENELGVQPPTGFWDPAGYCSDGDAQEFYRRRCVEIKHGRVSMIACIGYIVPEYFKWPGYISPSDGIKFADIPHGLDAITRVPAVGWFQIVLFGLAMELFAAYQDPTKLPGKLSSRLVIALTEIRNKSIAGGINNSGYEFGPFGIPNAPSIKDPEVRKQKLNAEIANGRLAMVAIMGLMFQNGTVGTTGPEMWLGASAEARGNASQVSYGAGMKPKTNMSQRPEYLAPTGMPVPALPPPADSAQARLPKMLRGTGGPFPNDVWDPLNLMEGKSEEQLLHWRAVELKHCRIAMLAVLGWFHVATGWHPIGDAAARMRVSDDPLINYTQLPIGGAFQVVFTIMVTEWLFKYVTKPPKEAPWDLVGWTPQLVADQEQPEWKERQLAELNNGRLAMIAFIVLVGQDMATGDYGPFLGTPGVGPANGAGSFDGLELFDGMPMPKSPYGNPPNVYPPVGILSYGPPGN